MKLKPIILSLYTSVNNIGSRNTRRESATRKGFLPSSGPLFLAGTPHEGMANLQPISLSVEESSIGNIPEVFADNPQRGGNGKNKQEAGKTKQFSGRKKKKDDHQGMKLEAMAEYQRRDQISLHLLDDDHQCSYLDRQHRRRDVGHDDSGYASDKRPDNGYEVGYPVKKTQEECIFHIEEEQPQINRQPDQKTDQNHTPQISTDGRINLLADYRQSLPGMGRKGADDERLDIFLVPDDKKSKDRNQNDDQQAIEKADDESSDVFQPGKQCRLDTRQILFNNFQHRGGQIETAIIILEIQKILMGFPGMMRKIGGYPLQIVQKVG